MKEIKGTYKCGHSWTTVVHGATKHEMKVIQDRYKNSACPKCEGGGAENAARNGRQAI